MICPQCTNEVPVTEAQFLSMYTCPKCQAVYFVDITGQPEFGDMSASMSVEDAVVSEAESLSLVSNSELSTIDSFDPLETVIENSFVPSADQVEDSSDLVSMSSNISESSEHSSAAVTEFNLAATEITDFANQDNSISTLSYDLKVSGLDTKETMSLFREAVEDSKFGWMAQDIFATIQNGECLFKDLNPIQAFVLAKRIQFLDIEMEWKQNVQI